MSVDLGGLPKLPDPDTIIADAGLIAASGARAAVHGTSLVTMWNGVQAVYAAPEQSLVYEAMRPVTDFTNEASIVAYLIQSALDTFAETVRAMESRHKDLINAAGTSYPESTDEDPDYGKNKAAEVTAGISALAREYAAAEEACADAIRQSDPAKMPSPPDFTESKAYDVGRTVGDEALDRVRRERTRILIPSTVQVTTLEIDEIFLRFADGTTITVTRGTLTNTLDQVYDVHESTRLTMNPTPGTIVEVPRWARRIGNAAGAFDIVLPIWDNAAQEWNQDLIDHRGYDTWDRVLSAGKNVVFEGGFGFGFSLLGTALGTALGAAGAGALGFAVGSVFPVVGNAIGGATGVATGAVAGGAIGSTVLGAVGEGLGSYLQDRTEGKTHDEAFEGALAEFFDQVW